MNPDFVDREAATIAAALILMAGGQVQISPAQMQESVGMTVSHTTDP
jgi:hypothetical protein